MSTDKTSGAAGLTSDELTLLYGWIDSVPLPLKKKNLARDFSDGFAVAKIVHHYLPQMVEIQLHNYRPASSTPQKKENWTQLRSKVFQKLNLKWDQALVQQVIEAKPGAIEKVLWGLRQKVVELTPTTGSTEEFVKGLIKGEEGEDLLKGKSLIRRSKSFHPYDKGEEKEVPVKALAKAKAPAATTLKAAKSVAAPGSATGAGPATGRPKTRPKTVPAPVAEVKQVKASAGKKVGPPPATATSAGPIPLRSKKSKLADKKEVKLEELKKKKKGKEVVEVEEGTAPPEGDGEEGILKKKKNELKEFEIHLGEPEIDLNANDGGAVPPTKLFYKGHKMVPALLLDVKTKEVENLEYIVSSLHKKVNFLDNLLQAKEAEMNELTKELELIKKDYPGEGPAQAKALVQTPQELEAEEEQVSTLMEKKAEGEGQKLKEEEEEVAQPQLVELKEVAKEQKEPEVEEEGMKKTEVEEGNANVFILGGGGLRRQDSRELVDQPGIKLSDMEII